jgi:hypothetical protein
MFGLLVLALSCCGCLKGDIFEFVTYDQPTDTFRYMQLELNIGSDASADLTHLAELWSERDQIIMYPEVFRLFDLSAILRIDAGHYRVINLGAASAANNPTLETSIPLDTIMVQPGKFFLTKDNTLAYFHEVTASGKVVDAALAARNKEIFGPSLVEAIDSEIKRRADGGKYGSWDEFRRQIAQGFDANKKNGAGNQPDGKAAPAPGNSPKDQNQGGVPLDNASLALLRKAIAAGELAVRRHGAEFELSVPLSRDDCRELKTTIDLWTNGVAEQLKAKPGNYAVALTSILRAEDDGHGKLVASIDVAALSKLQELSYGEARPDPKMDANYRDAIAALRSRSIPIDEKLTAKQVVEEFSATRP